MTIIHNAGTRGATDLVRINTIEDVASSDRAAPTPVDTLTRRVAYLAVELEELAVRLTELRDELEEAARDLAEVVR